LATILFGDSGGGADTNETFAGNVALSGTRVIAEGAGDDSLACDWNWPTPGANDMLLKLEDAAGQTLADAGKGYTAYRGTTSGAENEDASWLTESWLEEHGLSYNTDLAAYETATAEALPTGTEFSLMLWLKIAASTGAYQTPYYWRDAGMGIACESYWWTNDTITHHIYIGGWHNIAHAFTDGSIHCLIVSAKSGSRVRVAVDGDIASAAMASTFSNMNVNLQLGRADSGRDILGNIYGAYWATHELSDAEIAAISKRYAQGSAVIQYNFGAAQSLTNIAWNATETGDWEGDISKIEVYDQGLTAWVQKGGASPTSPIDLSGSPVTIGSAALADIIRVTVDPKSDTLQSETAKLLDMTLTHSAAGPSTFPYYYQMLGANRQGRVA